MVKKTHCRSGWLFYQKRFSACVENLRTRQIAKITLALYREIPPCIVIESILRPRRLWLSAGDDDARRFEKALPDTAITEYATFQRQVAYSASRHNAYCCVSLNDPIDKWLETIKYCSEGGERKSSSQAPMPDLYQRLSSILFCGMMTLTPRRKTLFRL